MPAYYDQPASFGNATVEDQNRFQKLPFYLVKNEVAQFPIWNVFDQLYGTVQWQPNMGNTMRGSTPQRSPVGRTFFFPNNIDTAPNKDVYQVTESTEDSRLKAQWYESFQFSFVPSFEVFWRDYIQFANKDIVQKIAVSNNQFIETNLWFASPNVYMAGNGVVSAPVGVGDPTLATAGTKTAAWFIAAVNDPNAGVANNLSLRTVYRAKMAMENDLAAPPFEKAQNMPDDNEGLKGKYVLLLSTEAWGAFPYDPDTNLLKSIELDLLFKDFNGLLFGNMICKFHRYPMRFNTQNVVDANGNVLYQAGFPIVPEIFDATDNKWKPNPYYTNLKTAPIEVAWILGADAARTVKVGPPPKEFAATNMSAEKFYSLRWNGEVRLTDQVPVVFSDGSWDFNHYGTQLKFISWCNHGYLVGERRYAMPIVFRRKRPSEQPV
jgi:hypothetical protein